MTILVLGDSNTFGLELPDLPPYLPNEWGNEYFDPTKGKQITLDPSQMAWPALLGQLRNETVVNHSLVGGSNDRIFRRAMSETVEFKYDLVICAWTALARFDIVFKQKELPVTINSPWIFKNLPWLDDYIKHHYNGLHVFERAIAQVIALQNHFKQIRQPYLFVDSMPVWPQPRNLLLNNVNTDSSIHRLTDQYYANIDCAGYPGFPTENLMSWTRNIPKAPNGHMSAAAHQLVAERLHRYLLEIGL
jgi:lysophospholipase L1-like esterase